MKKQRIIFASLFKGLSEKADSVSWQLAMLLCLGLFMCVFSTEALGSETNLQLNEHQAQDSSQHTTKLHFLASPYYRTGAFNPVHIQFLNPPPQYFELKTQGGPSYRFVNPPQELFLPFFLPKHANQIIARIDEQKEFYKLPPQELYREKSLPIIGFFGESLSSNAFFHGESSEGIKPSFLSLPIPEEKSFKWFEDWRFLSFFDALVLTAASPFLTREKYKKNIESYLISGGQVLILGEWPFATSGSNSQQKRIPSQNCRFGEDLGLDTISFQTSKPLLLQEDVFYHYSYGTGNIIHKEWTSTPSEESAVELRSLLNVFSKNFLQTKALEQAFLQKPQALFLSPMESKNFVETQANRAKQNVVLKLALLILSLLVIAFILSKFASRFQTLSLLHKVLFTVGGVAFCILFLVMTSHQYEYNFLRALHIHKASENQDQCFMTLYLMTDAKAPPFKNKLPGQSLVAPLAQKGETPIFTWSNNSWELELKAGSGVRIDFPSRILLPQKPQLQLTIRDDQVWIQDEGEALHYQAFMHKVSSYLGASQQSLLQAWVDNHVYAGKSWQVSFYPKLCAETLPLFQGDTQAFNKAEKQGYTLRNDDFGPFLVYRALPES